MSLKSDDKLIVDNKIQNFDTWDGSIKEVTADSEGIYHIKKASELAWVASEVNNGNNFSEKIIYLENNLDLNNKEWIPIGNGSNIFSGIFEGNDYNIKNFKVTDENEDQVQNNYKGLFGYVKNAEIKNINIHNAQIAGYKCIGSVIGYTEDSAISNINVYDSSVEVSVYGGAVIGAFKNGNGDNLNSYDGNVVCNKYACGGVIGYLATSIISNNYSNFIVDGSSSKESYNLIGGIIGYSAEAGKIYNVFSDSIVKGTSVVGGVVGQFQRGSYIDNVYSYANVEGTIKVGGIIGVDSASSPNSVYNINSYAIVNGNEMVGGVTGLVANGQHEYKNIYSKSKVIGDDSVGGVVGSFNDPNESIFLFKNIKSESEILGNSNFGNLYGFVKDGMMMNEIVE